MAGTGPTGIDRRQLLRGGLGLAATAGMISLLGSCSSAGGPAASVATTLNGPRTRGGTLRAAFVGGGAAETLNPYQGGTVLDFVRARAIHATLGDLDPSAVEGVRYNILSGIDVAADLSAYTLRVRPGATFTDGSPVTARDIAYSLNYVAQNGRGPYAVFVQDFDLTKAQVTDDATVVLPTKRPIADGRQILCFGTTFVIKDGTPDFTQDMPTCGPFRLTAFEAGRGATTVRHDGYAGAGDGPYLDGLELLSVNEGEARLNALRSGQIEFAHELSPVQARTAGADGGIVVAASTLPSVTGLYFLLNMQQGPFGDVRVRQAFKHAINRQAVVDTVLYGYGTVGNDLYSPGFGDYATGIEQRSYDPALARDLLNQAGARDLAVTLTTGPEVPGMVETAALYAESLKDVGVTVTIDERPAGQLYADMAGYLSAPFVAGYSTAVPPMLYYQVMSTVGNPLAFGWNRPDIDAEVIRARSTADAAEATRVAETVQRALWTDGNTVIPVFKYGITGQAANLVGVADGLLAQYPSFAEASLQ